MAGAVLACLGLIVFALGVAMSRGSSHRLPTGAALPPGKLQSRLEAASEALKADPQDIARLVEYGVLRFQEGRSSYPDAVNALEDARNLGSLDPALFYHLGVMYQDLGLFQFAATEYQRYLRHDPKNREVRLLLAKLYYSDGKLPEAIQEYEELLERHPSEPAVLENLALTLWKSGQTDGAETLLKGLLPDHLPSSPVSRRARYYLGRMAFEAKSHRLALEHYLAAAPQVGGEGASAEIGVPYFEIHAHVARNYEAMKLSQAALSAWERALATAPRTPSPQEETLLKEAKASVSKLKKQLAQSKKRRKK